MLNHIRRGEDGYLLNLDDWNPDVAQILATEINLVLTTDHWDILDILRTHYKNTKMTISMRGLIKLLQAEWPSSKANSTYLQNLFPEGSVLRQAYLLAGLPRPAKCL